MKTIWKYSIVADSICFEIPQGATLICIREVINEGQMWFMVDTLKPKEKRQFRVITTGAPLPKNGIYCGTFLTYEGSYVWHVFEIKPVPEGQ